MIDSPVLPDELDALPALVEQARFPTPSGLLATHGDWDHLLGRLAFPGAALGGGRASTAERLGRAPGEAQRELRTFDEELLIERPARSALGSMQALRCPGAVRWATASSSCTPPTGHTADGMAVLIGWAGVLVAGDYLSSVEIPTLHGGDAQAYVATLERLRPLLARVEQVVPGHGHVLDSARALRILEEDVAYVRALGGPGAPRRSYRREARTGPARAARAQPDRARIGKIQPDAALSARRVGA